MSVKVNIPLVLNYYTDKKRAIQVEGSTVGECLDNLVKKFPDTRDKLFAKNGKLYDYFDVLVNNRTSFPIGLAQPVKDGDELTIIFDAIAGG